MRAWKEVLLVAGATYAAGPVTAQASPNVAGLYATLSGGDFARVNSGIGADAQLRFPIRQGLSLGFGGQYTIHTVDMIDPNLKVWGVFGEPRYALPGAGVIKPYVAGRAGFVHHSISESGTRLSSNGFMFGGGGGILLGLGAANLDIGVLFGAVNFTKQQLNATATGISPNGTVVLLRAGLQFGGN